MDIGEKARFAMQVVRKAGALAQDSQDHLTIEHKTDNDYVTQTDRDIERMIKKALLNRYPGDGFLGEEFGLTGSPEGQWILDPIDGTTNYMRGLAEYSISLAYVQASRPLLGVVFCPALGLLYHAEKGRGAYRNEKPIHVSGETNLRDTLVGMAFAHRNPDVMPKMLRLIEALSHTAGDLRRCGSAALDLCRVADGSYGAFVEPCLNLYDIAAGVLLVQEAGGLITGFPGQEDAWFSGHVFASNGLLHPLVEKLIRSSFNG